MEIKICGIKYPDNAREVELLNPDFMGFIFYPKSSRYVGEYPDEKLFNLTNSTIKMTGVFVNEPIESILSKCRLYGLNVVQLHGDETPDMCQCIRKDYSVIKAFGLHSDFDFSVLSVYEGSCDFFLFDTKTDAYGGSGKKFSWELIEQYQLNTPFILSGGIDEETAGDLAKLNHPQFYGIDLNSRFETAPGLKDSQKLNSFIQKLRNKS